MTAHESLGPAAAPAREPDRDRGPCVVGIGASAGGLEALRALFASMPPEPGVAFVVVVHLSPEHESHLGALLQSCTPMPVRQVTKTMALEPNHVYVIPPNANLGAIDSHLRLSRLEERRNDRAPIDHFLRTLAAAHGARAVGVVLTGGGSDGALGLRRIREHGGLTIAQDPDEAEESSMPRAAIATGVVDCVLPLREMGQAIARFCSAKPHVAVPDTDEALDGTQRAALDQLLDLLRQRTGHDFAVYRRATLLRRIRRRMQLHRVETLPAYLQLLHDVAGEPRALCDDLLLTVTEFFQAPEVFEQLERGILPRLFDEKPGVNDRLRAWSVGCSTGEEAYSLAILLLEEAARRVSPPKLRVFATDMSYELLKRARHGLYPGEVAADVSAERLERFFDEEGGHYRVRAEVRDVVVFAAQNLFRDPPYPRLDLIVCRNLIADLQPDVRRGVLNLFAYALEPHGVLIASPGDVVHAAELFVPEDAAAGVFRKRPGAARGSAIPLSVAGAVAIGRRPGEGDDLAVVHGQLMERVAPPSLLVNADNDVVHYSERATPYVRMPGGDPTRDVLRLVREPVRSALRAALAHVRREGASWRSEPLDVWTDAGAARVVLRLEPAALADRPGLVLVAFEELREGALDRGLHAHETAAVEAIARLEDELAGAQRRIRGLIARDSDDWREIADSNENLQAANEELRFIFEELEQSKEELRAANAELQTLDDENRHKIQELAELSGDLKHLLESTGVATLFLDLELKIVRFTPQLGELFNVTPLDRGRPLADLTHWLRYDGFEADFRRVVERLEPVEREVASKAGRWYLMRLMPYRTPADVVDGLVLSLIDITDRKRAEERLREADRRKDEFLALLAHELRNPLAPIMTGIETLRLAGGNAAIVDQVSATMARQSKTLVRLVDDLLEVSRISGGRLRLTKAPTKLADLIRDAVAAVRPIIDRSGHELTVSTPPEPIMLDVDATRLAQVLGNLLNNAARYTSAGGRIALTARREGEQAVIEVRDNGIGIPEDIRGRVFEMFFQGNDTRLARNAGLGIGLTLAKSLVEMHGGTIAVDSAGVDGGSAFTVRLPVAAPSFAPAPSGDPVQRDLGGHRVLIVDDNEDAARTLDMLIKRLGANDVRVALSGADALAASVDMQPDLVLLDLKMPGMDGFEVARRLRQQPGGAAMSIVAVSGWGQDDHKRRTAEAGFNWHLTKPADLAALEALLAESPKRAS